MSDAARSISASVVNRPGDSRNACRARVVSPNIASKTCDVSTLSVAQALEDEKLTDPRSCRMSAKGSTPSIDNDRLFGSRNSRCPLTSIPEIFACKRSRSRRHSARSRSLSDLRCARAIASASPNPTMLGVFSVPERSPRSWPPPNVIGAIRTRGRR